MKALTNEQGKLNTAEEERQVAGAGKSSRRAFFTNGAGLPWLRHRGKYRLG